jgi:hypothetical protein
VFTDEPGQGVNRRQALIARGDATATMSFDVIEEIPNRLRRHIDHGQAVNGLMQAPRHEGQQLAQRVSVAVPRVRRQIALADQVLQQESTDPRTQRARLTHGGSP